MNNSNSNVGRIDYSIPTTTAKEKAKSNYSKAVREGYFWKAKLLLYGLRKRLIT